MLKRFKTDEGTKDLILMGSVVLLTAAANAIAMVRQDRTTKSYVDLKFQEHIIDQIDIEEI